MGDEVEELALVRAVLSSKQLLSLVQLFSVNFVKSARCFS